MRIKITHAPLFRAALTVRSTNKAEVRTYLRSIVVDASRGLVFGTDGARMLVAQCIERIDPEDFPPPPAPFLLEPAAPLPARGDLTGIDTDTHQIIDAQGRTLPYTEADADAPRLVDSWLRTLQSNHNGPAHAYEALFFNPALAFDVQRLLKATGLALAAGPPGPNDKPSLGPGVGLRVRFYGIELPPYDFVVMPLHPVQLAGLNHPETI